MTQRDSNLNWLRDLLEQLIGSHERLRWAQDAETIHVLTESMLRDLDSCRRLCESLDRGPRLRVAA